MIPVPGRAAARRRRWRDLTDAQRVAVVLGAAVQLGLQAAALRDLRRRPAGLVRGSRRGWAAASFLNLVGPLAYFVAGRRRS